MNREPSKQTATWLTTLAEGVPAGTVRYVCARLPDGQKYAVFVAPGMMRDDRRGVAAILRDARRKRFEPGHGLEQPS